MTLEETIQNAKRIADSYKDTAPDCDCRREHEQLAEWLTELKQRREADISQKPKTNGDRIRQMTDEELAAFMCKLSSCETCGFCTPAGCAENRDEWLKAECEDQVLLPAEIF